MNAGTVTAIASPNIALIKYWGNRDSEARIPANDSLSLTLSGLETKTTVAFRRDLDHHTIIINGQPASERTHGRVADLLSHIEIDWFAQIESESNFPTGAGVASSASGFCALALAATAAAGTQLSPRELSILARMGSGSAARSVFGGLVRLYTGQDSESSFAEQIFPPDQWPLIDLIAVVDPQHKVVGSTRGHALAKTSPLQSARIANTPIRMKRVLEAFEVRDFEKLADICELDSNMMHAVMHTSTPPLFYWTPATMTLMQSVHAWRAGGEAVFYTIDAGPNVHCLTLPESVPRVRSLLNQLPEVSSVLEAGIGTGARLVSSGS